MNLFSSYVNPSNQNMRSSEDLSLDESPTEAPPSEKRLQPLRFPIYYNFKVNKSLDFSYFYK